MILFNLIQYEGFHDQKTSENRRKILAVFHFFVTEHKSDALFDFNCLDLNLETIYWSFNLFAKL